MQQPSTASVLTTLVLAASLAAHVSAQTGAIAPDVRDVERTVREAVGAELGRDLDDVLREVANGVRNAEAGSRAQNRSFTAEKTSTETRTLKIGASGSLELTTTVGDITVVAGRGDTASVEILRRARGRTDADAAAGLAQATVTFDERPDRASVRALRPPDSRNAPYSVSISLRVTAPPGLRLQAHTTDGSVAITGNHGAIEAEVISGAITLTDVARVSEAHTISGAITVRDATTDGEISLGSVDGNILLERVTPRRIAVDSISGNIVVHDATCGDVTLKSLSGRVEYGGPIASGGRYTLRSYSDDVRFAPGGGHGFDLEASTFAGDVRLDPALHLKVLSASRRATHATSGDADATVSITTFSGDITVGAAGARR